MIYHLRWLNLLTIGIIGAEFSNKQSFGSAKKYSLLKGWYSFLKVCTIFPDLNSHYKHLLRLQALQNVSWHKTTLFYHLVKGFSFCFHSAGGIAYSRNVSAVSPPGN